MSDSVEGLSRTVLTASRVRLFGRRPVFKADTAFSHADIECLERRIGCLLPVHLSQWLLAVGYGDIDDELSFRAAWFSSIEEGQLKGGARFAQDIGGNFYAFDSHGRIYFLSRTEPVFGVMAATFTAFVAELVRRDYKLSDWTENLKTHEYHW